MISCSHVENFSFQALAELFKNLFSLSDVLKKPINDRIKFILAPNSVKFLVSKVTKVILVTKLQIFKEGVVCSTPNYRATLSSVNKRHEDGRNIHEDFLQKSTQISCVILTPRISSDRCTSGFGPPRIWPGRNKSASGYGPTDQIL